MSPTIGFGLASGRQAVVPTDAAARAWHGAAMTKYRKPKAFDLFIEALVHPVRFR